MTRFREWRLAALAAEAADLAAYATATHPESPERVRAAELHRVADEAREAYDEEYTIENGRSEPSGFGGGPRGAL